MKTLLVSFEDVILSRLPRYNHEILLPGVVTKFDLPDLYGALCPMPLTLINPLRADKTPAEQTDVDRVFSRTRETYRNLDASEAWAVTAGVEGFYPISADHRGATELVDRLSAELGISPKILINSAFMRP